MAAEDATTESGDTAAAAAAETAPAKAVSKVEPKPKLPVRKKPAELGNCTARFNFQKPLLDQNGQSVVKLDANGKDMLQEQPRSPVDEKDHVLIPVRQRLKAVTHWKIARSNMDMPNLISGLGIEGNDIEMMRSPDAEMTMNDLQKFSEGVSRKFGWGPEDIILKKGSESITTRVEEVDGKDYKFVTTTGQYHSVDIFTEIDFPHHHPAVKKENMDLEAEEMEMPWPEHTYPKIFADTTMNDYVAESALMGNQRQLTRVLSLEPMTKSLRRTKLCHFLQAKMLLADLGLKCEGTHGLWEMSLNPEHHPDVPEDTRKVLVHNLRLKDVELNALSCRAVWGLSTTSASRRELVGFNAVEALYKLLHHTMKIEIVTAKENLAKHRANVFARHKKLVELWIENDAQDQHNKKYGRMQGKPSLAGPHPDTFPPVPDPQPEELQSAESKQTERERDYLQASVLGAMNMMMVDKQCRERVLVVDPGISTVLKLCRELPGYSDNYQRHRRIVAAQILCNMVMRDMTIRQSILPGAVNTLLGLMKERGPGIMEVNHFISACLQVYVLDEKSMEMIDQDVRKVEGSKEEQNGVVRMFNQCLDSLHDFVGRLENHDCDSMTPKGIITVCERTSLSMWGASKQQATGFKADVPFERLASLCNLLQRFIALQLQPEYRNLVFWRVGHNLAAALTSFAINANSARCLMGVATGETEETLNPNSAASVLMVLASPRFLEGFVRSSALTGLAFLATHALSAAGEDCLVGIYRQRMLATGCFPTVLACMSATVHDESVDTLLRCGAVTLMYMSTELKEVGNGISSWELFQLVMLMVDTKDIRVVESLMVTLWAVLRDPASRALIRDPVPGQHLEFSTQVVKRVHTECITAADLRALFVQYAERRPREENNGMLQRSDSHQSLWGTTDKDMPSMQIIDPYNAFNPKNKKRPSTREAQEMNGSLADPGDQGADQDFTGSGSNSRNPSRPPSPARQRSRPGSAMSRAAGSQPVSRSTSGLLSPKAPAGSENLSPTKAEASMLPEEAADDPHNDTAKGIQLKMEDNPYPGFFLPKPPNRVLNPMQWLSTGEHHADKWWGIKQLFRVWDQWHEAVHMAGDPANTEAWVPVMKFNEFLVAVLWILLVSDDIAVPSRRTHLSQREVIDAQAHGQGFWWMVEVQNHKVDLTKHPLLVRALEILLWEAALPHTRHWTARQLAVNALWNMAVRRPAVEAFLIDKGIVEVLLNIINDVGAHSKPTWPASLRDTAGMFLGELMTEQEIICRLPDHAKVVEQVQIAMITLIKTKVRRLEVCGLRVLGRMTYTAPLDSPNSHAYLNKTKLLIAEHGGIKLLINIVNYNMAKLTTSETFFAKSTTMKKSKTFVSKSGKLDMEDYDLEDAEFAVDEPDENEIGEEAMMVHTFRVLRNLSIVPNLQVQMAKQCLLTLMKVSNFMTEYFNDLIEEPSKHLNDIMNHTSAIMMNLSTHPENRTRFYKVELRESFWSETERAIQLRMNPHNKEDNDYPIMGAGSPPATPQQRSHATSICDSMRSEMNPRLSLYNEDGEASLPGTPRSTTTQSDITSCLSFYTNKGRMPFAARGAHLAGVLGSRDGWASPSGFLENEDSRTELVVPPVNAWAAVTKDLPFERNHRVGRSRGRTRQGTGSAVPRSGANTARAVTAGVRAVSAGVRAATAGGTTRPLKIVPRVMSASTSRADKPASAKVGKGGSYGGGGGSRTKAKAEGVRYSFPGAAPKSGRFASLKSSTPPKGPLSEDRDERLSQDGEQAVKGISKVEFEAWERDTFEDSFAVRAIMRATGHGYISENLKQIAKAPNWRQREILPAWKIHHPENGNVGPEEHMEDPDGLQALPQLHVTLKRPLRYLWKPCDEEADTMMGNNRWAPVVKEYREMPRIDPSSHGEIAGALMTTPYPRYARNELSEAKQLVEANESKRVQGDVKMLRPPSAKMKGGRRPRTMLHPKGGNEDSTQAQETFTLGVNLNPQASRTLITFEEKKKSFDEVMNLKPKLHMFEHHHGSRVYEGLMPDYQLPNGKKAFFYYESRMVEEVEVLLRDPMMAPVTLAATLQSSMPMDVDLAANTRLPGVAPEMDILKPVPPSAPLPKRHTLEVVAPKDVRTYKAFADLIERPLTFRCVAKQKALFKSVTEKIPIRPATPPPVKPVWRIELSVFKNRATESEGRAFVHQQRMTERLVRTDFGRLTAKEKFVASLNREWENIAYSPLTPEERLKKLESVLAKHFMSCISLFDYYANMGANNPFQMSLNAFSSCLEDCKIPDNESPFCKKSDCDTLFIVAKSGSVEKGSKLDKIKDDNCLLRFEFIEVLIRISIAKVGKTEGLDPADAFDALMERVVLPNAHPGAKLDRDAFRKERLYNEEMDLLFTAHVFMLKTVWSAHRGRPGGGGLRTKGLGLTDWQEILSKSKMMDDRFTLQEARLAFLCSRMHTSDESRDYNQYTCLTFTDFLEALGRMADMKMIPTDDELEGAGFVKNENGEGHPRFDWVLHLENTGETAIPRRPSAQPTYGHPEYAPSERPLHEKVEALLEVMYERMYYNPQNLQPFSKDVLRKMLNKQDTERGD